MRPPVVVSVVVVVAGRVVRVAGDALLDAAGLASAPDADAVPDRAGHHGHHDQHHDAEPRVRSPVARAIEHPLDDAAGPDGEHVARHGAGALGRLGAVAVRRTGRVGVVERPVPELLVVGHDPHLRARAVKPEEVRGKAADRGPTRRTYQPRPAGGRVTWLARLAGDEVHQPAGHDHDLAHRRTVEQRRDALVGARRGFVRDVVGAGRRRVTRPRTLPSTCTGISTSSSTSSAGSGTGNVSNAIVRLVHRAAPTAPRRRAA